MINKENMKIFESKHALAHFFGQLLMEKTANNDKVTIALSGGSTPRAIFDALAESFVDKIDWNKVCLFWGDERCVSPTDEESNYKMTKDHLLSKVSIPEGQVYRIQGELDSGQAAKEYEEVLKQVLPLNNDLPEFDIMLLGMGDDGHTASVFPYEIELWDAKELCVVATHPVSGQKRVSLTGDIINNSKEIYFLVTGENKAEKLDEILNQKAGFEKYPAAKVGKPIWLVDNDAARLL
jgi:6-phosphogluconolactonase